jgi:hypothetical protein
LNKIIDNNFKEPSDVSNNDLEKKVHI